MKGVVVGLAVALAMGGTAVGAGAAPPPKPRVPAVAASRTAAPGIADDRVLVGLAPGTDTATADRIAAQVGARAVQRSGDTLIVTPSAAAAAPSGGALSAQSRAIASDPGVRYVEPNYRITADTLPLPPNDPCFAYDAGNPPAGCPAGGSGGQWALRTIAPTGTSADKAWNTTAGSRDVVVGVLDSGADLTHPDLVANLWSNDDALGACGFGTHGFNAVNDSCIPADDDGHGTHVSGIVGAVGNNNVGVAGIAQRVSLMELRMLQKSTTPGEAATGSIADAIQAIDWALAAKDAGVNLKVLQASWGAQFASFPQALYDAIARARDDGVLFVAAAGNGTLNVDANTVYPCAFDLTNVICVAASTDTGQLASFSNFGSASVDLAAPGTGILSTVPPGLVSGCGTAAYCEFDGTSMATPLVSGGAVDVLTALPSLSVSALKARLLAAVDVPSPALPVATQGRFDLCKAIPACESTPSAPPSAPEGLTATPSGTQAQLDWAPPASNGSAFIITGYRVKWSGHTQVVTVLPSPAPPPTTFTITGLAEDTDVPVTVEAANGVGAGNTPTTYGPAASITVRVHSTGPPSAVRNLATSVDTAGNPVLGWSAPSSAGGGQAEITGYKVSWPGFTKLIGIPSGQATPPTSLTVPGLAGTTTFTVSATNQLPLAGATWGPGATKSMGPSAAGEYTALSPARVLDTRDGTGGRLGPLGQGASFNLQVTGRGGVPGTGVAAVVMNVTATAPNAASYLTAWPTGVARPTISNLNYVPGQTVPNLVTVAVGSGGKVSLFNHAGSAQVVADVVGYYASATGALGGRFHQLVPARYFDTRDGTGGVPRAPVGPVSRLRFKVTGKDGVPASGVTGVVMNVTVTAPTTAGFLTVYPDDVARPLASNLNFVPGQTVPNLVAVRVPASGFVDFFNSQGHTHVIADVVGYYDASRATNAGRFVALTPSRLLDTRNGPGPIGANQYLVLPVSGRAGVPTSGAGAAVLNVTVTQPTGAGYLTAFPDDSCTFPLASNLNFTPGQTVQNLAISGLAGESDCTNTVGAVDLYNSKGSTQVIADLFGYFTS